MTQQREPDKADSTYRYLHLSSEELAQLPPDELFQAYLELRRLLDIIIDGAIFYDEDNQPAGQVITFPISSSSP